MDLLPGIYAQIPSERHSAGRKLAAQPAQHIVYPALSRKPLHHLLHLAELFQQPIHILYLRTGARRYPFFARSFDNIGCAPLH